MSKKTTHYFFYVTVTFIEAHKNNFLTMLNDWNSEKLYQIVTFPVLAYLVWRKQFRDNNVLFSCVKLTEEHN